MYEGFDYDTRQEHRNIALLVRNGNEIKTENLTRQQESGFGGCMTRRRYDSGLQIGWVDWRVRDAIPELYGKPTIALPRTRMEGVWQIHEIDVPPEPVTTHYVNEDFLGGQSPHMTTIEDPNFCVVYRRGLFDPSRTMFLGRAESKTLIYDTIDILTEKVLEQGFFSRPLRGLTEENGAQYVSDRMGVLLMTGAIGTIIAGLNDLSILSILPLAGLVGMVMPYLSIKAGYHDSLKADQARTAKLDEGAKKFLYGLEAEMFILERYVALKKQREAA